MHMFLLGREVYVPINHRHVARHHALLERLWDTETQSAPGLREAYYDVIVRVNSPSEMAREMFGGPGLGRYFLSYCQR